MKLNNDYEIPYILDYTGNFLQIKSHTLSSSCILHVSE